MHSHMYIFYTLKLFLKSFSVSAFFKFSIVLQYQLDVIFMSRHYALTQSRKACQLLQGIVTN